jgi:hypothetical protein
MDFFKSLYREIDFSTTAIKKFAWLFTIIFLSLSGYFYWKDGILIPEYQSLTGLFASLALIFLLSGIIKPNFLKPLYAAWMYLALILGTVMSMLIISLVYYFLMTPIGVVRRIIKSKGHYQTGFDASAESYWIPKDKKEVDPLKLEKQY